MTTDWQEMIPLSGSVCLFCKLQSHYFSQVNGLPAFASPSSNIISVLSVITLERSISNINRHTAERAYKCHICYQKIKRKSYTESVLLLLQLGHHAVPSNYTLLPVK